MKLQHPDNTGKPIEATGYWADLLKVNGWVEVQAKPQDDKK